MKITINQVLQQAIAKHKDGKIEDAERLYRLIIKTIPTHKDANHNLGILLVSLNKSAEALPLFKIAVEADPNHEQIWISYIKNLIENKKFEEAEVSLIKAEELKPDFVEAHFYLSIIHKEFNRFDEAEKSLKKVIELAPDYADAHNDLGAILKEVGRLEEAETSIKTAVRLNPNYAEAHSNLGTILKEVGRLEEAEICYKKALRIDSTNKKFFTGYGNLLLRLNKHIRGLKYINDGEGVIEFTQSGLKII